MIVHKYFDLPELREYQTWVCANGCGDCRPADKVQERMVETDINSNVINAIYEHYKVSSCCSDDLLLFDYGFEEFVKFKEIER
ncbi:hypothetical protein UFOVP136_60 [uncultured Caudovirales phage]|uniref:Uncharacterized protein n=1 Tax=uncultured Caudovirales phage TaxID=2100421 RepID=A0A6J5LFW9_9CAUD|nr:hypothetical protein UFOVP136_60 [uncultured Caudovirales phage]